MNDESLLGGGYIQTNTFKEQAYELIKDAILYNRFRIGAIYSHGSNLQRIENQPYSGAGSIA